MTFRLWPILLFVLLMSVLLIGVQVWNAKNVDWDEFQRSWQSIIAVIGGVVGMLTTLRKDRT